MAMPIRPPLSFPMISGRIKVGWKLAEKAMWSPKVKAAQTEKAITSTLSLGGMSATRRNIARMFAEAARMPAAPTGDMPRRTATSSRGRAR
ncbi:hypothetical protein FQZ97_1178470 [compost metagenome]